MDVRTFDALFIGRPQDATLFDEIIIDANPMYFKRKGGYEYAKEFYAEAYRFIEEKFGSDNVIAAVMHAVVLPVVEKEILWSERCKTSKLPGTVKEVINQISHSKKWASLHTMLLILSMRLMRRDKKHYRQNSNV